MSEINKLPRISKTFQAKLKHHLEFPFLKKEKLPKNKSTLDHQIIEAFR